MSTTPGFGLKNTVALVERRQADRQDVAITATVRRSEEAPIAIEIEIISGRGFLARSPAAFAKGTILRVALPGGKSPHARVVWLEDGKMGCEFLSRVDLNELLPQPAPRRAPAGAPARGFGPRETSPQPERLHRVGNDQYDLFLRG